MRHFTWTLGIAIGLGVGGLTTASAQQVALAERGPRFLVSERDGPRPVDVGRTAVLQRRISLDMRDVTLGQALEAIVSASGLRLGYSSDVAPVNRIVRLVAEDITVAGALSVVLLDANLDVLFQRDGQAALVRRSVTSATGTVKGVVTDIATGEPIVAADLRVVGSTIAATTDEGGRYVLRDVPAGEQRVTARRIGYEAETQKLIVLEAGMADLDFMLKAVATRLDELVTTVTGDQRRLEVGNTIATINADSLMQIAPVMSFGDLLQGRAPGVFSLPEGPNVGQAGRIRIRGLNSALLSNDPVVVIDGIRVEAGAGVPAFSGVDPNAAGFTGRLADLDPDEIASVEVVKGPSATTLYGTDAANGVLVITTKRGQPGRTRWTAFAEQGLLEQRLDEFPDAYYAFGRSTATDEPQRCTLLQRAEGACVVDSLGSFNTLTHPDTRPFKSGHREQYGLQVSGGTVGGTTYFLSGDYEQETGPAFMPAVDQAFVRAQQGRDVPEWQVRPNAYERVNLRANLSAPLGRLGSVTLATGFVSNQARQPGNLPAIQAGFRDNNDGWGLDGAFRPAFAFAQRNEDVVRRFTASLAAAYTAWEWLTLRGTLGADLSTNAYGQLTRRGEDGPFGSPTGFRNANELGIARYSLDLGATATRALSAAVSSKTSVGVQYNRRAQRGTTVVAFDLPLGGETIAGAGFTCCTEEATLTTAVAGAYLEEVLGLQDRLFITGALRFDGGSAFGQDFSVAAYPKASVSWVVSDGQAGPRLPAVSALRLRAAYGASGVQPGPTDALSLITVQNGLTVDGTAIGPTAVLVSGNPDLKPERSSEVEAGIDLELFASRVRLEFTAYQRTSTDALVSRPIADDAGGGSRIENLGSVRNRGLELLLSADLLKGRTLATGFTVTGALNENRLRRLGEGVVARNPLSESFVVGQHELDYPLFGHWGFVIESLADANGNGIIEPPELVLSTETRFLGSTFPTREATVAPYIKLFGERVHLSGLLQYRGGFYRWHRSHSCSLTQAACRAMNDPSTPLAEQARVTALASLGATGPEMKDASYLLLRELSLGLTVPTSMVRVLGARAGQVVLAGRNLAQLWSAERVPVENAASVNTDSFVGGGGLEGIPGSSTYWLLRVNLTY